MTTVGFIGSGNIGGTVARLAVAAGYDVVLSNSRGPQTLKDLAEELGPRARAATPAEAAAAGDLVVVSIPPRAYLAVPAQPLAGKPVLDTINYIPQRDGRIPELYDGPLSSSEVLQLHLGTAHVVKVFNNITFWHLASLARPAGAADRSALPIAGDDPAAKAAVTRFLDAISALLWTTGASIAASIVGRVLVETARPSDSRRSDVRDKEIYRFGEYASRWFVVAGAAAALAMAMARWDYFWIANVIYLGFVLWAIAGSVVKLLAYRRGL